VNASEFDILSNAAAGMDAQRAALDLAARNVAASEADGGEFARMVPRYAFAPTPDADGMGDDDGVEPPQSLGDGEEDSGSDADATVGDAPTVRYLGAVPVRGVSPDAVTEMVAVLDAQRAYDTNASVFDVGKRLAERTIDMGRVQ
jgi:flagellar basal body rod protein FlgC